MNATSDRTTTFLVLGVLIAGGAFAGALYIQYVDGLKPCQLCIWQRWPYLGLIPAMAALVVSGAPRRILAGLAAAAFLVGVGLAMYHVGVEYGWWKGPQSCSGAAIFDLGGFSGGNMMNALSRPQGPSCTDIPWTFMGLSLAGWNVLITASASAAFICAALCFRRS